MDETRQRSPFRKRKPPVEVTASALAMSTLILSLPPIYLPIWAVFVSWAGTFAMGGPSRENMMSMWRVMPVGAFFALLMVLGFNHASHYLTGARLIIAEMAILFVLNTAMMLLAKFPGLSFAPGMFFGEASYFATVYGGFGPVPHHPLVAFLATVLMNAVGPAYAWLTVKWAASPRAA